MQTGKIKIKLKLEMFRQLFGKFSTPLLHLVKTYIGGQSQILDFFIASLKESLRKPNWDLYFYPAPVDHMTHANQQNPNKTETLGVLSSFWQIFDTYSPPSENPY